MTRSLSWPHVVLWTYVALIALLLFLPAIAHGAATPPSFSIDDATAAENSGTIVFKIRKHGHLNNLPSILNLYGVDGTAKFGSDFDSVSQSVNFTAAETVKYVAIHLVNDAVPEPIETFTAKIRAVSNARLYDGSAIGTITDDDVAPQPTPDPTPHPCYDYSGTTPLGAVPGSNCPARVCPGSPNPVDWSLPCPPAPSAMMLMKNGLVYRVAGAAIPDRFINIAGVSIVPVIYDHDTTGHYVVPPGVETEIQYLFIGGTPLADPLVTVGA